MGEGHDVRYSRFRLWHPHQSALQNPCLGTCLSKQGTDANGDTYYFSRETGASVWELPAGGIVIPDPPAVDWSVVGGSSMGRIAEGDSEEEEEEEEEGGGKKEEEEVPEEERSQRRLMLGESGEETSEAARDSGVEDGRVGAAENPLMMAWLHWGQAQAHAHPSEPPHQATVDDTDRNEDQGGKGAAVTDRASRSPSSSPRPLPRSPSAVR